jgi:hypothetical protein
LKDVQFELLANQKDDLLIGELARKFIADKDQNKLRDSRTKEFYKVV